MKERLRSMWRFRPILQRLPSRLYAAELPRTLSAFAACARSVPLRPNSASSSDRRSRSCRARFHSGRCASSNRARAESSTRLPPGTSLRRRSSPRIETRIRALPVFPGSAARPAAEMHVPMPHANAQRHTLVEFLGRGLARCGVHHADRLHAFRSAFVEIEPGRCRSIASFSLPARQ